MLDQATQQEVVINITLIDRQGCNIVAETDSKPVEETLRNISVLHVAATNYARTSKLMHRINYTYTKSILQPLRIMISSA